tara:strand:- start:21039 stop:21809 length:771 start_codon:yes stop_codon:yes gene_type:complete
MWIIPNNYPLYSVYVQDMGVSKEDLSLPGLNIEQSLMWRSKPSPLPTWLRRWKRGGQLAPAPVWTDLKTLPVEIFRDRVSLITGGYPCQPFSSAGNRAGKDDPRHLWPYIRDIIQAVRPVRVFFENVEGHISLGLSSVLSDLEEDGFRTAWGIFSAAEVGAPHQRKRVYILADSESQRVQGLWASREQEPYAHGQEKLSMRKSEGSREAQWPAEPDVGRVVDGCADRVDRIRLLGNGVVPQTAAKAWRVLSARLAG